MDTALETPTPLPLEPQPEPFGYTVDTWHGLPHYVCLCGWDSLQQGRITQHVQHCPVTAGEPEPPQPTPPPPPPMPGEPTEPEDEPSPIRVPVPGDEPEQPEAQEA